MTYIVSWVSAHSVIIINCGRMLLLSVTGVKNSGKKLLQSAADISKCDNNYKVRRNKINRKFC